jgi:gamma-glutamylcyclotransferase (GGCT)/AIG2-like uncharacterized protein YtfP
VTRQLYFAYGSNLNVEGMARRCPDAEPVGIGCLDNWALTFRGVADIERRAGASVAGALWEISNRDLERLDRYEGYPSLYGRELVPIRTPWGYAKAIAYVMRDDYLGLPSPSYYGSIETGYQSWNLPLIDLQAARDRVRARLRDLGYTQFDPDGPKRLRAA